MTFATTSFPALGSTATLLVDDDGALDLARRILHDELLAIDAACSRFRSDSDLSRINANAGEATRVSARCIEAITVAQWAALVTDGCVDPTVGTAVRLFGYDRDFADVAPGGPPLHVHRVDVPGWQTIALDEAARTVRVPVGVELDLGATAKALCADRSARHIHDVTGVGVVVSLGGDLAIAGAAPAGGWSVRVTDDHTIDEGGQVVALHGGGLATSGTARRNWARGDRQLHHLVDPRTGEPAASQWRTVSVAAASCVDANIASTAAMVMGAAAIEWLAARNLPARLVTPDGHVTTIGAWPVDASTVEAAAC